jgi:hypothetical protein
MHRESDFVNTEWYKFSIFTPKEIKKTPCKKCNFVKSGERGAHGLGEDLPNPLLGKV